MKAKGEGLVRESPIGKHRESKPSVDLVSAGSLTPSQGQRGRWPRDSGCVTVHISEESFAREIRTIFKNSSGVQSL